MKKIKLKNSNWITYGFIAISIIAALLLVDRFMPNSSSMANDSEVSLANIKKQADCSCGCDYTLENCEKFDPSCSTRPGIISNVEGMIDQGKTEQEILAALGASSGTQVEFGDLVDDDPVKGNKDAPVTIVEFSDFQCPFCAAFYFQTLSQLEEEYIKTGKVKLVYRDFPLSFHQNAQKAAEASECADEQGAFWEYHDILFEKQGEWSNAKTNIFKDYAKQLDLNSNQFDQCLDSGKMADEVKKDLQDGSAYGVNGTPAFFINGELISGAQPIGAFRQVIDKYLE